MTIDLLKSNIRRMKEIIREAYIFSIHLEDIEYFETKKGFVIENEEKRLLRDAISSSMVQLKILKDTIPKLIKTLGFYKRIGTADIKPVMKSEKLIQVKYNPIDREKRESISLVISDKDKKEFLENLSKSNLSINQLKKKYSIEKNLPEFVRPTGYAKISNFLFKNKANQLLAEGYFYNLNKNLRKINYTSVVGTYVSMIFFTVFISFFASILLVVILMFFNIGITLPFITSLPEDTDMILRFVKIFWIILAIPLGAGFLMYFYPSSEAKSLGKRIEQELPFVTIHMSAIATSGVDPLGFFKIILKNEEYLYTNTELKKLINLVNFHGKDLVSALRETARTSPSQKLKELFEGLATTITSGGSLKNFLEKRADNLLFDYKIERERYTKTSETFMDIYISVVIAAPMILLMLFVIMGSTGTLGNFIGLPVNVLGLLIVLAIALLNIGFLVILRLKQPVM